MTAGPLSLGRLLADSPALAEALAGAERAAEADAPVLILGEPGTGRSTLARALHRAGPRRAGPLVEVDAAALPAPLFEGELFGWRAGAFTGAEQDREGRVARAAGGTLLLDHVEELPLALQPKLLRLLAERRYAPLGGVETEADVRFMATGPEDLAERIDRGAFRADLFYRLGVLAFRLPPLRRRRDEVAALAAALTADLAERFGLAAPPLAAESLGWMRRYGWPGNLTELRNLLERALVMAGPRGGGADGPAPLAPEPPATARDQPPRSLAEAERAEILRALAYTRGHQGRGGLLVLVDGPWKILGAKWGLVERRQ